MCLENDLEFINFGLRLKNKKQVQTIVSQLDNGKKKKSKRKTKHIEDGCYVDGWTNYKC